MRHSNILSLGLVLVAGVSLVTPAMAVVNMVYVPIGDAGNTADPLTGSLYGAVDHAYNIGKYEVTNAQYVDFLNAKGASNSFGIYNIHMLSITQTGSAGGYTYSVNSSYANNPVVSVTWFDAARFCNWLGNGQGSGDTEAGAYTLISGQTTGIVTVNPGAQVYIPSENEWYKAAYYNGAAGTYSLYPDGRNDINHADANYYPNVPGLVNVNRGTASSYGTYGQGGNAWEWNDAVVSGTRRGRRGGSWNYIPLTGMGLASTARLTEDPSVEYNDIGFRVASVPEPTSVFLAIFASGMLLTRRKG